ncbi:hypothetical protein SS05631_c04300 [Sinorhizobium sp. CCBAU 05631]|nr:hypothetical protein SS05631_c04300 [Sinorhizobium sp. CCBAU 05631]
MQSNARSVKDLLPAQVCVSKGPQRNLAIFRAFNVAAPLHPRW